MVTQFVLKVNTSTLEIEASIADRHQPFLAVQGNLAHAHKIVLYAEKKPILELKDVLSGLLATMAYYYVMGYEYCAHVSKALQYLQKYLFNIFQPEVCDSVKELAMYLKTE